MRSAQCLKQIEVQGRQLLVVGGSDGLVDVFEDEKQTMVFLPFRDD
jgi:hypothetical protein